MKPSKWINLILLVLLVAALACNMPGQNQNAAPQADQGESAPTAGVVPDANPTTEPVSGPDNPEPSAEEPPVVEAPVAGDSGAEKPAPVEASPSAYPIPFNEGLASLNSYRMAVVIDTAGPSTEDWSMTQVYVDYDSQSDSRHTRNESTGYSSEDGEPFEDVSEEYQVGNLMCTLAYGEAEMTELEPIEREFRDVTLSLLEFNPLIENPTLAGEETINGIEGEHYTFQVTSLGIQSGAEVIESDGEYWLAKDGRYLIKYELTVEMRTAPAGDSSAEAYRGQIRIDLQDVNQQIGISMPAECTAAPIEG